jgi:uncharacterized protein YifE (UPF0438 family)
MPLLDRETLEAVIRRLRRREFTVLDFADALRRQMPETWSALVARFGEFGEKRRYTLSTYLSNRLEEYSRREDSLLERHPHYMEDRAAGYRRPTPAEKKRFGSPWIAVYRKRSGRRRRPG